MMQLVSTPTMTVGRDRITLHIDLEKGDIQAIQRIIDDVNTSAQPDKFGVQIKRMRRKRSLDANAYYWVLVGEIAKAVGLTDAEAHNWLLMDYGEPEKTLEGSLRYVLMRDSDEYMRSIENHVRPTDVTEDRGGVLYRWFVKMKGSSRYDTREMSRLIDGAVQEAKALGIETMKPEEIDEMKKRWGA